MSTNIEWAVARRNERLDAVRDNANSGKLRIYSGTKPANADAALSGNTLLAELTMNATAFPAASGGVLTANAITGDTSADASGTASFWRIYESDGSTIFAQGTCGTSGESMTLPTLTITAGVAVNITSLTLTDPAT